MVSTFHTNFPEPQPPWNLWLRISAIALLMSVGCAKSQQNNGVPNGGTSTNDDSVLDVEIFQTDGSGASHFQIGQYELIQSPSFLHDELVGHFENLTQAIVTIQDGLCLDIAAEQDFDDNGRMDLLLCNIAACSGHCCLNEYFVVSDFGGGEFKRSQFVGLALHAPAIEKWDGKWSILIERNDKSDASLGLTNFMERFVLHNGELEKVEEIHAKMITSILEVNAMAYDSLDRRLPLELAYDLDEDGKSDLITGNLWAHWGRVNWSVKFGNGKSMMDGTPFKRLGVLPTVTEGLHDLVVDNDRVLVWTGKRYEEKEGSLAK